MSNINDLWSKSGIKCPNCGGIDTEINMKEALFSEPMKFQYRCKCGHHWNSSEYEPTVNYQNILPPQKQSGAYGWVCPVCGAGVSPYQDHCPCCSGKSLIPTWTCGGGCDEPASKGVPFVTDTTTLSPDSGTIESYATVNDIKNFSNVATTKGIAFGVNNLTPQQQKEEERKRKQDKNDKSK